MLHKKDKKPSPSSILENITLFDREAAEAIGKEVLALMEKNPGMTLKQATGVTVEALEEVYSLAYTFYNQGRYQEATVLFKFLSGTAPTTYKYLFGLGASCQQLKNYEEAAAGYFIALHIEPTNPLPAYYITDCFLRQNKKEEARDFAELTVEICEDKPEHAVLKNRCALIVKSLKEEK